jgi:hypothetical protein
MDLGTFKDAMVTAADLPGLFAYLMIMSVSLLAIGTTSVADAMRDKRRAVARVR